MTDDEFYQAFVKHLRNADMNIFWEKFNFYLLHRDIRAINKNLTSDKKLDITYSGASILWNWNEMSREAYLKMHNYFDSKGDEIYAENAINRFCEIWQNSPRKKALIIYNRPHSYKEYPRKGERPFAAQLVIDRFPDRVANVMINWCGFDLLTGRKLTISPIQNGKWDAAFEVCDHKSIGFDFADSPFGADAFDHYSVPVDPTTYADVYNGFIFYKPINEWVSSIDYKGFVDDEFADEFCKRNMYMGDSEEDAKAYTEFMKNQETRSFQFDEEMLSPFYEQMNKYLHKPGTEKGK